MVTSGTNEIVGAVVAVVVFLLVCLYCCCRKGDEIKEMNVNPEGRVRDGMVCVVITK